MASKPKGWSSLYCQPGEAPFASLARALVPEFAGDEAAISQLVHLSEPGEAVAVLSRWRDRHDKALLVVDQFEELFTLSSPEALSGFADFLRGVVDDCGVHVLLAMRDDYLFRCHSFETLRPVFDALFPVEQPSSESLRLALVEPAKSLGYSFEDEDLSGEMVAEVEGERGALPLLAFGVARLWEKRDRDRQLMTRQAYGEIGGVAGALGLHAESTLKSIGVDRVSVVREIFRSLVTAEGTRAVREWDELISVFGSQDTDAGAGFIPARDEAGEVLSRLVDARLLTSFEEEDLNGEGSRRVEVVHESLLSSWPRLVRWRTQDADSAQLRDQLRQAARTWDEHGRTRDFLWTGKAYREFAVWHENYPGGLSELEEDFASEMTWHAKRRKRRRRIAVAAVVMIAATVAAVTTMLWQRSVQETHRAEAQKLITLGHMELIEGFSEFSESAEVIAYALASLGLAESHEARLLALEALWHGPPRREIEMNAWGLTFSSDGRQLAVGSPRENISVMSWTGETVAQLQPGNPGQSPITWLRFAPASGLLYSASSLPSRGARVWSLEDQKLRSHIDFEGQQTFGHLDEDGHRLETLTVSTDRSYFTIRAWPQPAGDPTVLGRLPYHGVPDIDPTGTWLAYPVETELRLLPLENLGDSTTARIGGHEDRIQSVAFDRAGTRIAVRDRSDEIRLWAVKESSLELVRTIRGRGEKLEFNHDGSMLVSSRGTNHFLWNLERPPDAAPMAMWMTSSESAVAFDPSGRWFAAGHRNRVGFWPLDRRYPSVLSGHAQGAQYVVFAPDGSWLASASWDGTVRLWPLSASSEMRARVLFDNRARQDPDLYCLDVAPDGRFLVTGAVNGEVWLLPMNGDSPSLVGRTSDVVLAIAVSPDAQTIATGGGFTNPEERVIRLWDTDSGQERVLDPNDGQVVSDLEFLKDGRLLSAHAGGALRIWDLGNGSSEEMMDNGATYFRLSADESSAVVRSSGIASWGDVRYLNLVNGELRDLPGFGSKARGIDINPSGTIVATGGIDGILRVGRATDELPHLLFARNQEDPWSVAFSRDGRWIAAGGIDGELRLWPMPDLSKPPLHTLPREELIAKLKTLTNLRVVRDEESSTGWKLTHDPFPGWETVPEW
jgi:WD40 repeat protein